MNNRLYCTFVEHNEVKEVSERIQSSYKILFNKIFVLESLEGEKVMLTYNVDLGNSNNEFAIDNTILVLLPITPSSFKIQCHRDNTVV